MGLLGIYLVPKSAHGCHRDRAGRSRRERRTVQAPECRIRLPRPRRQRLASVHSSLRYNQVSGRARLARRSSVPPANNTTAMLAIMLVGATAMEAVAIARGTPSSRPMTAPVPSATHISSLVKPRNTAGSRLSRAGRKTQVPSARRSIASFMPTSQDSGSRGQDPDDDHHQQGSDADYGAEVFPSLALVLHVGIDGQGMPSHTEKSEQG